MTTFKPGDLALIIKIPNQSYASIPAPQPGEIITIDSDLLQTGTVVNTYFGTNRAKEPGYISHGMNGYKTFCWHRTLKPLPPYDPSTDEEEQKDISLFGSIHENR